MSSSDPIQRFNEYWASVGTPDAQARRDIERAEYEARYEAWRDQRQTFIADDGSIGSQPLTWDGQPLYSPETVKEGLFDASAFEQQPGQLAIEQQDES